MIGRVVVVDGGAATVGGGGVVAISHALWRDRVPDPAMRDDATSIYRDVLRFFSSQDDFVSVLSPVGDGLLMASKRVH